MIPVPTGARVWLASGHTDMRKGFDGLALLVQETPKRDRLHLWRSAGVAKDDRGFLLGHADVETQNKVYGHDGPGLHPLQAIVEKIRYEGLRLPTAK